ncbi:hypothetical protein [Coprobacillus sp. AF33-1AC]|uniref:hypothetical protein n=1 Tax=Coprobacillus sp. AF33-1AC TaxID=2292032 RepID=UPI000E4CF04D|nr:hypothetical protein [Coprobacillus sp. AF33-1AC]RHM59774.1 hypothetical protein DWZ53_08735 [Coprobacillus sp. AF33-1AC]
MSSLESKKALNFDLSDALVKKYYPSKNYKKAWIDIQKYLVQNDFQHRQYSGYVSCHKISMIYVTQLVGDMFVLYEWLQYCVKEFDVTIVGDEYSLKNYIHQENIFN